MITKKVQVYVDGACSPNPGKGGWAVRVLDAETGAIIIDLSGAVESTTSSRMELQAPIEALRHLSTPHEVQIFSDSAYVVNCFLDQWYKGWRRRGWKTAGNKEVANRDLWEQLLALTDFHRVIWTKVRGHQGNLHNEACDQMAVRARLSLL